LFQLIVGLEQEQCAVMKTIDELDLSQMHRNIRPTGLDLVLTIMIWYHKSVNIRFWKKCRPIRRN